MHAWTIGAGPPPLGGGFSKGPPPLFILGGGLFRRGEISRRGNVDFFERSPPYGCRSVSKLKNGGKFVFARWGGTFAWGGPFQISGLDQILRKRPPHMGGAENFAPQARPKMSDFEQKRQFFDVFSHISAKFHPYEGNFW